MPLDAELLFDMRFITNPFYRRTSAPDEPGLDQPVKDYIMAQPPPSFSGEMDRAAGHDAAAIPAEEASLA